MSSNKYKFIQYKNPKTSLDLKVYALAKDLLNSVSFHDFAYKFNKGLLNIKSGNAIKAYIEYKAVIIDEWMPEEYVQIIKPEDSLNDEILLADIIINTL
jgi:hypothetical protein